MDSDALLRMLAEDAAEAHPDALDRSRLTAVEVLPARPPRTTGLPDWLSPLIVQRLGLAGITSLYDHQAEAVRRIRAGSHTVVATGTASGKSLCYQLPLLQAVLDDDRTTALYLSPTKALARDQVRALRDFRLPQVRAAAYDGDLPRAERDAIRRTANVVLTNPDMLHVGILPNHRRWGDFLHRLALVIVDECHVARGVFGSHVAAILRRLRRICSHYSAEPTFALASATIGNPAEHATSLVGAPVEEVATDGAGRPRMVIGLWEPPLIDDQLRTRRSTLAEASDLLAAIATTDRSTLAFARSRAGVELLAIHARRNAPDLEVRAYRAGLLADERRTVERGLIDGTIRAVAATDALELGVDIGRLDAVIVAGWPGTAASFWQQAGRAGRRGNEALVVFIGDDNPLDHYLLAHPVRLLGRPLEHARSDVSNPHILAPHLECAAWELPLDADEEWFPPADSTPLIEAGIADGRLRRRNDRVYWAGRGSPAASVHIRSTMGAPVTIVEGSTGVVIGDVDAARAPATVHPGASYLHQGRSWRVTDLDLDTGVAAVERDDGTTYTRPRSDTDLLVLSELRRRPWGRCVLSFGRVEVTTQVLAYERRHVFSGESLGVVELDLPRQRLQTAAVWLTTPQPVLDVAALSTQRWPGALHAAEHAAIGLLPLFAMCDRWDIGGVSTPWHPDTANPTIFVYDGIPGGAGITARAFDIDALWWAATRDAIRACPCDDGCPSCVQSPKCGNGNEPLDKAGAIALLDAALADHDAA
ncbi:MAG TPA: DEAD/DEAH box helicase [Euzebyales bacterium]|nr:DEAD/DEAH box helicase [Euzebyales bacterium]